MKLGRTTKIRQNFFIIILLSLLSEQQKFGRIFCAFGSFIIHDTSVSSPYGSTHVVYPYLRSRLSSLLANRLSRLNPSSKFPPPSFLRIARPLPPSIHPSTSSCCFDIRPRQPLFFVLGPLGCAVYPMLTVGFVTNGSKGHRLSRRNGLRNNENENPLQWVDEN